MIFKIDWDIVLSNSELKSILDNLISDNFLKDIENEIKNYDWELDEDDIDGIIFDNFNWEFDLANMFCKRISDKLPDNNIDVYTEDYYDFSDEEIKFIVDYIKPKLNLNLNYESTSN